ncbi:MAG: FAD-dependent oxidoreductase [Gammaproteobacteria bacterium]|nr:FAD-dependent oxidoreductase [Gammaproteobacteria bacterium]MCP5199978.1 FAD-dependent oxidoreductase [Gammaproteobacteria bacterium]
MAESDFQPAAAGGRRIAVIGAGIAGLGAAWALARRHAVTLFEAEARLGGHANTVELQLDGTRLAVDTGFIVYNARNYPHLVALFEQLGVPTQVSDMSFAVSLDGGRVEYAGSNLNGLFAQRRNTLRPRFWRMLSDIRRFYRAAAGYRDTLAPDTSIGELLTREGYSEVFVEDHLVPMAAAIWSASRADIRRYPARAFIQFFANHGLLELGERPPWRTVTGGSRAYVERLAAATPCVRAPRAVRVERHAHGVCVVDGDGRRGEFDEVVFATHADQTLALLDQPSAAERAVLGAVAYSRNVAWLHEDARLMPRRRAAWSSWNYLHDARLAEGEPLCVSYWMNRLQDLPTTRQLIVTLNPLSPPDAALSHGRYDYEHPIFTAATGTAQARSAALQGQAHSWFCGAWLGHGFHEDGLQSGLWVAERLGAPAPWANAHGYDRLPASYREAASRAA